jgi:zinc and cadmium transporter
MIIIILVTLIVGIGSVWIADLLVVRVGIGDSQGSHGQQGLLGLAAGALLSTSFTHLLPEAIESNADVHELFIAVLSGLVFFFLLSKAELWRHSH